MAEEERQGLFDDALDIFSRGDEEKEEEEQEERTVDPEYEATLERAKREAAQSRARAAEDKLEEAEAKLEEAERKAAEAEERAERSEELKHRVLEEAEEEAEAREEEEVHTYVVKEGDTLSAIARDQLGDANRWPEIYEANKDKIDDPDLIYPGQEFTIPS